MNFKDVLKRVAKMDGGEKIRIALEKTELAREIYVDGLKRRSKSTVRRTLPA